jgi:transcription antitermination factor NusB
VSRPHRARRLALQALCCLDAQGDKVADLVDDFIAQANDDAETIAAAREVLAAAVANRDECDRLLTQHASRWELHRLAMVDRNILRLAICELRAQAATAGVIITEAIKLAQEFSTAESPRFINGVLDAVAKEISGEAAEADNGQQG